MQMAQALEEEFQKTKEAAVQAAKEAAAAKASLGFTSPASKLSRAMSAPQAVGLHDDAIERRAGHRQRHWTRTILTQSHMVAQMDAVLDKSRLVNGKPTSLAEPLAQRRSLVLG
eukprot:Skav209283  [mRNA]  locus=scaffold1552:409814:411836:+ [translate_table: standard]